MADTDTESDLGQERRELLLTDPPSPPGRARSVLSTGLGRDAARRLSFHPPWALAALAAIVAFAAGWLADIVLVFRHAGAVNIQARLLDLVGVGTVAWAGLVLGAAALLWAGRRLGPSGTGAGATPGGAWSSLETWDAVGLLYCAMACGVCAAVGVVIELANFSNGVDSALSGLMNHCGAVALAAAAAWWMLRELAGRWAAR